MSTKKTKTTKIQNRLVSIIIPVFNKSEFTDKCIKKIYQNTSNELDFEIIIVDNASTDNTESIITEWEKKKENLRYVKLEQNFKFGYACNFGASLASGDILLFLNNDTEPQEGWLKAGVNRLLSDDNIGIVGAKLLYPDNTIQHCGIDFFNDVNPDYKIWPLHRYMNMLPDDPIVNIAEEVPAVTGAALFIQKNLFMEIDKFDLEYKMYFEDTDLCFKVRSEGYKIYYEPKSVIIHHEGKSSPNQEVIDALNKESASLFYSKWKDEIIQLEKELEFVEERNSIYTVFNNKIYSKDFCLVNSNGSVEFDDKGFKDFFVKLLSLGKAYYHFGGAGDALLLLSTFYSKDPNQTVISFSNSTKALKVFFQSFRKLKYFYLLPIPQDPIINGYIRKLLHGFSNVLGMGVTPSDNYEKEWNRTTNIFEDYNVEKRPEWIKEFTGKKNQEFQVTIAPMGSNFGMFKSKKNIISPDSWAQIIEFLNSKNISPIVIGIPPEEENYPILEGCINKRSFSFKEQMEIIAASDIFIGADSWGKTFSALAGIPTIVFKPIYGDDLKGWKDSSDFVFLDPWDNITVVDSMNEFYSIFDKIVNGIEENNYSGEKQLVSKEEEKTAESDYEILWNGPVFDNSGYADESRNFVLGLLEKKIPLKLNPLNWSNSVALLPFEIEKKLNKAKLTKLNYKKKIISITHMPPVNLLYSENFYNIGRTMFETDSLPNEWVEKCNKIDEIWVPSQFNIDSFSSAGVKKDRLFKIHESIDTNLFLNTKEEIKSIKSINKFKFLSIFDWHLRKGWDVLIKTFVEEFKEEEAVLILKVWASTNNMNLEQIKSQVHQFLKKEFHIKKIPSNIIFYSDFLDVNEFPKLYNSVDAYVSPTRGEGWGRPMMEAMLKGLPTIATRCTGQLEFMNDDNSFLIDCKLVPVQKEAVIENPFTKGQNWFEPSLESTKKAMRIVYKGGKEVLEKAKNAQKDIKNNFNREIITKQIINRLNIIRKSKLGKNKHDHKIIWEGKINSKSSLAKVNYEMLAHLNLIVDNIKILTDDKLKQFKEQIISKKDIETDNSEFGIHLRHEFPPNLTPPKSGRWVIIQPWEFGPLPKKWVEVFSRDVDEMWVPSNFVRDEYTQSGISEDRVFVIPNGFNPQHFNKEKASISLKTKKNFKFLFVGGTIYRKGIDLLLKAYMEQFSAMDDVVLIIKDMGGDSFYNGQTFKDEIQKIKADKNAPEIEYLDKFLSEKELKGLYQTADVLVHPYRGEGFGLPILESMACGTPAIVTNGGAALDFCNTENSFLVDAEKTIYKNKIVGELETVDFPWLYEVSLDALKRSMQYSFDNRNEVIQKGEKAFQFVHENFTWEKSAEKIQERIEILSMKPIVRFENEKIEKTNLFNISITETFKYIDKKEYKNALSQIDIAINNFIKNNESKINLDELQVVKGNLYIATNNLEKAKETFEAALNENPTSSSACMGLGDIFQKVEEYEPAKMMFEWAVRNDEKNEAAIQKLHTINKALGFDENDLSLSEQVE